MALGRLRPGELLAGAGGLALLATTFLDWYAIGEPGAAPFAGVTAWEAFAVVDLLLAATGLLGLGLAVVTATQRSPALPVAGSVVTVAVAVVTLLVVAFRLLDAPGPDALVEVRAGARLGLLAVVAVLAGGWLAMRREAPGPAVPPPPDVPARPPPPPGAATPRPDDPT